MVRLELELVYRPDGAPTENAILTVLRARGGALLSRSRVDGAKYHALLVDVPEAELEAVLAGDTTGLIGAESVMHIRPQSAVHLTIFEEQPGQVGGPSPPPTADPIVAVFDAVPLAGHPRLAGRLSVDDPFDLERLAVGRRVHGTAMASAVLHGDLNGGQQVPLSRRVYFVNLMFAPPDPQEPERFPDRLPADLFEEAVLRMLVGQDAAAPDVIVVNASLGDRNKPFTGRMSGWARVIDHLAYTHGLLFLISAGNQLSDLVTPDMSVIEFEDLPAPEKARAALRATAAAMAHRRILAPAEAVNALTVGALHTDGYAPGHMPASTFDVWGGTGLSGITSGLGPGYRNAVKPDLLAPGGRHHVRVLGSGHGHMLRPVQSNILGGILVAAPPAGADLNPDRLARSLGTSVATAYLTGAAARAHEALEASYEDFLMIGRAQRASLLKALLVHCARWTEARDLIVEVLGPANNKQHVLQRDNVRRFLGYGAVDTSIVVECANDRATLWGAGQLGREESHTFTLPLPAAMSGKALPHEVSCTVAWLSPPRIGAINYRGARLRLIEPREGIELLAVKAAGHQPDSNQAHRGTVIHRRWTGDKAAALGSEGAMSLMVQREPDEIDDPIGYAMVTTVTMPGVQEVYAQVRARIAVQPKTAALVGA